MMPLRTPRWYIFFILSAGFLLHSFMLNGSFRNVDDRFSIVENPLIQNPANLDEVFQHGYFKDRSYYRPLVNLSFMLEYQLFGLNAFFYYLDNLFLHLWGALLVFAVARQLLRESLNSWPTLRQDYAAFWAALLFVIHPIQWEAVANVPGRSILLCHVFQMISLWLFLQSARASYRRIWYVAALFAFGLALLCKESAAMLPFILIAYLYWIKKDHSWRGRLGIVPFFFVLGVYVVLRKILGMTQMFLWPTFGAHALGVLTFIQGTLTYGRLFLFPFGLHFDRSLAVLTAIHGPVIIALGFYATLIAGLWYWRQRIHPLVFFCLAWFFIELIPVSQLVTSIGVGPGHISLAEHFLYIPSVGIFILMGMGFLWMARLWQSQRVFSQDFYYFLIGAFLLNLSALTVQNNIYATQELSMLERSVQFDPTNTRILYSVGFLFADKRQFHQAETYFRRILELEPWNIQARIALAKSLMDQERSFEAVQEYEKVSDPQGYAELYQRNLKLAYQILIGKYQQMIEKDPGNAQAYYSLGVFYQKNAQIEPAIAAYQKALELDADMAEAAFNLASTYEQLGQSPEAIHYYEYFLAQPATEDALRQYARERLRVIDGR